MNWNTIRNDLNNLTPQNRKEFNLTRFFRQIGRPDHYFIPETDWKQIRHAFRKHAEQGPEETVQPGSYRVVILPDFDSDQGWFSRVVRAESLDMQSVLSDPSKLLPFLDDPQLGDEYKVHPTPVESVTGKSSMTVSVANCKKLKGLPLIEVKEPIIGNNSAELSATVDAANNTIVKNIPHENATAFNVTAWDTFNCSSPEEKTRIFNDMPFLFRDSGATEGPTFYQAARALRTYFAQDIIGNELAMFIDSQLTIATNEWLVNVCGYTVAKGTGAHLSINSFVADMEDLSNYLKANDEPAHQQLHVADENTHLVNVLKLFNHTNPFKEVSEDKPLTPLEQLKAELALIVQRPLYIAVVNKRGGPMHISGEPVVMRRSMYPEYFELVESGFEGTMGDEVSFDVTDKLLRFSESGNTWLFSYSSFDPNVATLRHIANTKPLVLLPMD